MKKVVFYIALQLAAIALPLASFSQTTISLMLTTQIKIDSVSVVDISGRERHDLPYKETLDFNFAKNEIDCYNVRYFINKRMYWKQLWLDGGHVTLITHLADTSNLVIDTVLNSPTYYQVQDYQNHLKTSLNDTVKRNQFLLKELESNLNNVRSTAIAYDYIRLNQNSRTSLLKLKRELSRQKADFSWSLFYQIGIGRLNQLLEIKALDLSAFRFISTFGKPSSLSLTGYDYYLLDFWFLDCAPCRQDHISIKSKLEKLKTKNVDVISISTDNVTELHRWNQYLISHKYKWQNYLQGEGSKLTDYLGMHGFPAYVLIDAKGIIIGNFGTIKDVYTHLKVD